MEAKLNEPKLEQPTAEHAEYEAWFKRKVQEGLDDPGFLTAEEMEAEAATWRARTRQRLAAEARRVAGEVSLEAPSKG